MYLGTTRHYTAFSWKDDPFPPHPPFEQADCDDVEDELQDDGNNDLHTCILNFL